MLWRAEKLPDDTSSPAWCCARTVNDGPGATFMDLPLSHRPKRARGLTVGRSVGLRAMPTSSSKSSEIADSFTVPLK
jgi:hypothetical protein